MVFGDDPRLMRLHQAKVRMTESTGIMSGPHESSFSEFMNTYAEDGPDGAMLRYSDVMKLESVQETTLAQSRFNVPRVKEMNLGSLQGMENSQQTERQDEEEKEIDLDLAVEGIGSLLDGLSGILGN